MSDDRKDLPPANSPNFTEKVREALSTYLGNRGNPLDRGVTLRDLSDAGLVDLNPRWLASGRKLNPIGGAGYALTNLASGTPGPTGPSGPSGPAGVYEPDLTAPPIPTGFTVAAGISNLLVECDAQTYTQGHGHAKSRLYGATWISGPLPVFSSAQVITEFQGNVASHATNPATTWHLWLTWVTEDGVESTSPSGGTTGVVVTTGQDVSSLVKAMTGPGNPFTILPMTTIIDGVTFPAGTYSTNAFIQDLQVTRGKIASLAVDDGKIASLSAAKITAGAIGVGSYIQSTNFTAGSAGWKINADGTAELANAVVRGGVYATYGNIGGNTINSTGMQSPGYVEGSSGWRLDSNGVLKAVGGTFSGTVSASTINGSTINGTTINSSTLNSGAINLQGDGWTGWGYARSAGKWWGDGANGWIFARSGADGSTFSEIKNGPSRIWVSSWDDCGISFPGITMTNGGLTISQLDVINTANLAGNAVTTSNSASGNGTVSTSLRVPAGQTLRIIAIGQANELYTSAAFEYSNPMSVEINGSAIGSSSMNPRRSGELDYYWNNATAIGKFDFYSAWGQSVTVSVACAYRNSEISKTIVAFGMLR